MPLSFVQSLIVANHYLCWVGVSLLRVSDANDAPGLSWDSRQLSYSLSLSPSLCPIEASYQLTMPPIIEHFQ